MADELVGGQMVDSGTFYTPESIKLKQKLAASMMMQGLDTSPIRSGWQGAARIAQAMLGGYNLHNLEQEEKSSQLGQTRSLATALLGGPPGGTPTALPSYQVGNSGPTAGPPTGISASKPPSFTPEINAGIEKHAQQYGVDPNHLRALVTIESGGDPNNVTGRYVGLGQLGPEEWKKFGGQGDRRNADESLRVTALKMRAESDDFRNKYGRDPTPGEMYLIHQQGAGGFDAHMKNPDQPAWKSMASTAEGRQKGDNWSKAAIWLNVPESERRKYGSVDGITSAQFSKLWTDRVSGLIPQKPAQVAQAAQPVTDSPTALGAQAFPAAKAAAVDEGGSTGMPAPAPAGNTPVLRGVPPPNPTQSAPIPDYVQRMIQSPDPRIQQQGLQQALALQQKAALAEQQTPLQRAQTQNAIAESRKHTIEADIAEQDRKPSQEKLASQIQGHLESIAQAPHEFGRQAFERALGPWSNADTNENTAGYIGSTVNTLGGLVAKGVGELKASGQGGAVPTEVRQRVNGDLIALLDTLKPYLRVKGEGSSSNLDVTILKQIQDGIATSRTVEEYNRAIENARQRISKVVGFEIPALRPQARSQASPQHAEEVTTGMEKALNESSPSLVRDTLARVIYGVSPDRPKEQQNASTASKGLNKEQLAEELARAQQDPKRMQSILRQLGLSGQEPPQQPPIFGAP